MHSVTQFRRLSTSKMVYSDERYIHTLLRYGDTPKRQVTDSKAKLISKHLCWQQASMDKSLTLTVDTTMTDHDCWLELICVFMFLSRTMRASFLLWLFSVASDDHLSFKMSVADFECSSPFHCIALRVIDRYLLVYISFAPVYDV